MHTHTIINNLKEDKRRENVTYQDWGSQGSHRNPDRSYGMILGFLLLTVNPMNLKLLNLQPATHRYFRVLAKHH